MKYCIIGCNGQLGTDMLATLEAAGHAVCGYDLPQFDLTEPTGIRTQLETDRPDIIVNAAAFTAVDDCESQSERAFLINESAVAALARTARDLAIPLVHFSTDYVFDGSARRPYVETDSTQPQTVYGRSKLAGEERLAHIWPRHWSVRIAWLYGAYGANFVKTILRAAQQARTAGRALRIVNDQFGSPTWTCNVCEQVLLITQHAPWGVYHATAQGYCSWFDFAVRIVAAAGIDVTVEPCATTEYPRPAPRPPWSVLDNSRLRALNIDCMPPWDEGFDTFWHLHGTQLVSAIH